MDFNFWIILIITVVCSFLLGYFVRDLISTISVYFALNSRTIANGVMKKNKIPQHIREQILELDIFDKGDL